MVARKYRSFIIVGLFINYFSKLFGVLFLLIDDVYRLGQWAFQKFSSGTTPKPGISGETISRTEFLSKAALVSVSIPAVTMSFGIISGAHNYRIRKKILKFSNLPRSFDGIRVAQLSDIHSGSFYNKRAVRHGIEMLMNEKPDIVFFTGDLVNDEAKEMNEYVDVFNKINAPLGIYSTLGNHDYGDYRRWPTKEAKVKNLEDLKGVHKMMGWDLLLNENREIKVNGEHLSVIGVENWGAGRFSKYGDLEKAYKGTDDSPFKILLSHDPSHWDAQIRKDYADIDLTLAGHTHGFQFGIEVGDFKWSPSQYIYKQWAGLYQEENQFLYVNRGFGYIGYPGRIGILPEITILELKSA
jgi:predicted MPP superfamily phosphohydrolase